MSEKALVRQEARPARAAQLPPDLGDAARRYAETTLRRSPATLRTYRSAYERFARWLQEEGRGRDGAGGEALPVEAFTADALARYLDEIELTKSAATVKKERSALNRLAKYLHQLGAIDATEILMVETKQARGSQRSRRGLDEATWARVRKLARARLHPAPRERVSAAVARRDLALVLALGEMGLRSQEARSLRVASIGARRAGALAPWLRVEGKGAKPRDLPIPPEVERALGEWLRERPPEVCAEAEQGLLFPRLGRRRSDGGFPDAGGMLSDHALAEIVRPLMVGAGVAPEQAIPHVLRHTYGSLFMARGGELSRLQALMGHASPETTAQYVHHEERDLERAVLANAHGGGLVSERARGRAAA